MVILQLPKICQTGNNFGVKPVITISKKNIKGIYSVDYSDLEEKGTVSFEYFKGKFNAGEVIEFTISPNEGYSIEDKSVKMNDTVLTPDSKGVYSFKMPIKNVVLTASYKLMDYKLSYDLAGGKLVNQNPQTYTIETDNIILNNPIREGYEFTGWSGTDIEGTTKEVTISKGSTGERNYTANFKPIDYTISYELNGGVLENENPSSYTIETEDITLNNPTKVGNDFIGWSGTDIDGMSKDVTILKGSKGNRTYVANFELIDIKVEYVSNGGNSIEPTVQKYGTKLSELPIGVRTGYDFEGWYVDEKLENKYEIAELTKDITLYAKYTPIVYKLSYELIDGTLENENPEEYTIEDEITLNNPTKNGYKFLGWRNLDDDEIKETYVIEKGTYGDIVLIAEYKVIDYTISYELNGGQAENPTTYNILTETFTLNNPTKEGYKFLGWTSPALMATMNGVTITKGSYGDLEFIATWEKEPEVEEDNETNTPTTPDDGKDEEVDTPTTPDDSKDEEVNKPTDSNKGENDEDKNTENNKVDTNKNNNTSKPNSTTEKEVDEEVKLKEYTISFNSNGGSKVESITAEKDENITAPVDPIREGYVFDGWWIDEKFTELFNFDKMPDNDLELYAKWQVKSISINGITVERLGNETFDEDITFVIKEAIDNKQIVEALEKEKLEKLKLFSIEFYKAEKQLNSLYSLDVKITIPLEKLGLDNGNYKLVSIKNDGTIEHLDSSIKDGKLIFKTNELNSYAVVREVKESTNYIWIILVIVLIVLLIVIFYNKNKKSKKKNR